LAASAEFFSWDSAACSSSRKTVYKLKKSRECHAWTFELPPIVALRELCVASNLRSHSADDLTELNTAA
jgi:hypothetical protein